MGLLDFIKKKTEESANKAQGIYHQLNPFDGGRTYDTNQRGVNPGVANPINMKSDDTPGFQLSNNSLTRGLSRGYDQVNLFDNGRSWQTRQPDTSISNYQQGLNIVKPMVQPPAAMLNTIGNQIPQFVGSVNSVLSTQEESRAVDNLNRAKKSGNIDDINRAKDRLSKAQDRVRMNQSFNDAIQSNFQKDKGGFLNAGTFFNSDEAQRGDLKTGLTSIGGGTLSTAATVLPFVRGGTVLNTLSGKNMTTGASVLKKMGLLGLEGGAYGGAFTAGDQLNREGKIDPKQVAIGTALGGTIGAAIPVAGAGNALLRNKVDATTVGKTINNTSSNIIKAVNEQSKGTVRVINKAISNLGEKVTPLDESGSLGRIPKDAQEVIDAANQAVRNGNLDEARLLKESLGEYGGEVKLPENKSASNTGSKVSSEDNIQLAKERFGQSNITREAPNPKIGRTESISQIMNSDTTRAITTPAEDIASKYGGKAADIERNINRYGEDATRNTYARLSDSASVKNLDAVATSELKKMRAESSKGTAPASRNSVNRELTPPKLSDTETGLKQEALKYKSAEEFVNSRQPLYHGGGGINEMTDSVRILTPEEKMKYPSSGGGYVGLSTTADKNYAKQFSQSIGGRGDVAEMRLNPGAKVLELPSGKAIDDMSADELTRLSKKYDVIKSVEDNEYRILNENAVVTRKQLTDFYNQAHAETPKPIKETPVVKEAPKPNADDSLKQEALKYKNAEKFVKSKKPEPQKSKVEVESNPVKETPKVTIKKSEPKAKVVDRSKNSRLDADYDPNSQALHLAGGGDEEFIPTPTSRDRFVNKLTPDERRVLDDFQYSEIQGNLTIDAENQGVYEHLLKTMSKLSTDEQTKVWKMMGNFSDKGKFVAKSEAQVDGMIRQATKGVSETIWINNKKVPISEATGGTVKVVDGLYVDARTGKRLYKSDLADYAVDYVDKPAKILGKSKAGVTQNNKMSDAEFKSLADTEPTKTPEVKVTKSSTEPTVQAEPVKEQPKVTVIDKSKPTKEPIAKVNKDPNRPSDISGTTGEVKSISQQVKDLPDHNKMSSSSVAEIESFRDNAYKYTQEIERKLGTERITKMADDILNAKGDVSKIPKSSKDLYDKHFRELFENLSEGRRTKGGTVKEYYFPETFEHRGGIVDMGWGKILRASMDFGSNLVRKGKMTTETVADPSTRVKQYIDGFLSDRYGNTSEWKVQQIAKEAEKLKPDATLEQRVSGAKKTVDLVNKLNNQTQKISLGGFGKRKVVHQGKTVDVMGELNGVGEAYGNKLTDIDVKGQGIEYITKINHIRVNNQALGDVAGMNQYRDAPAIARTIIDEAKNANEVKDAIAKYINDKFTLLSKEERNSIINSIRRNINSDTFVADSKSKLADNLGLAISLEKSLKEASNRQFIEFGSTHKITNSKTREIMNELGNHMLTSEKVTNEFSAKVVQKVLTAQNALFRKANIGSAINEMSDIGTLNAIFGRGVLKSLKYSGKILQKYGIENYDLDPATAKLLDAAMESGNFEQGVSQLVNDGVKKNARKLNDLTNFYHLAENYKASLALQASESKWAARGLKGTELTEKVLDDFRKATLPVDKFTKTALDNYPLYTQYLTWQIRNMGRQYNLLTGNLNAGEFRDMDKQMQRVIRNAYTNLPSQTVFWLASNGLKGTPILTAFGLTDFTGMTDKDFSGISQDDKNFYDKNVSKYVGMSTTGSLLNDIIQNYEKGKLNEKYTDADYNPYKDNRSVAGEIVDARGMPQFIRNAVNMNTVMEQGYSSNKDGRVQYLAPTNPLDIGRGFVFGKGSTFPGREYSGNKDVVVRTKEGMKQGGNVVVSAGKSVSNMAKEQLNIKEQNYNRPMSSLNYADYNGKVKEALKSTDKAGAKAMLDGGRAYNNALDSLRRTDKDTYDKYIQSISNDLVSPEKWRERSITKDGKVDLSIYNALKKREQQRVKDLGGTINPLYDGKLNDNQVKMILRMKSAPTGEDMTLSNLLFKEQWYKDFQERSKKYTNTTDFDNSRATQRVKDWNDLENKRFDLNTFTDKDGNPTESSKKYPTIAQYKAIDKAYGYDSQEMKNFWKSDYNQYKVERDSQILDELKIINKMRKIENEEPMSLETLRQAKEVYREDSDAKKAKSSGSSGGSSRSRGSSSNAFSGMGQYFKTIKGGNVRQTSLTVKKVNPSVKVKGRGKVTVSNIKRQRARM